MRPFEGKEWRDQMDQISKEWDDITWPDGPITGIVHWNEMREWQEAKNNLEAKRLDAYAARRGPVGWVPFGETLWIGLGSDGAPWIARRVV